MITLWWEQMERILEVDLMVVAGLRSWDQLSVAPQSSFYGYNALLFVIPYSRRDPFANF